MAARIREQLLVVVHVEDDVEARRQIGVEHVVDTRHESGFDRIGRRAERMGGKAHRQPDRREACLPDAGRVRVLERAAPRTLARRLEHVGEVDAFAERERNARGGPGGGTGREGSGL